MALSDYKPAGDSKTRFSSRVDSYVKARPTYPREIISYLTKEIALTPQWTIADIGSGTGISTQLFLENGNTVYAIEPNAPMRNAAEKSLAGFANYKSINASAETTTLKDHEIDLIVAAQAFHWFDRDVTRLEWRRILRPDGWALIMWNNRKLDTTPFLREYEQLLLTFGTDYRMVKHRHVSINPQKFADFFGHTSYRTVKFQNAQRLDWQSLHARLMSSSYAPQPDDPRHQPMLAALHQSFDRHQSDGVVTIEYETELFFGQL